MGEATNESKLNSWIGESSRVRWWVMGIGLGLLQIERNMKTRDGERRCVLGLLHFAHLFICSFVFRCDFMSFCCCCCIYWKFVCCFVFDYLSTLFCRVLLASTYFLRRSTNRVRASFIECVLLLLFGECARSAVFFSFFLWNLESVCFYHDLVIRSLLLHTIFDVFFLASVAPAERFWNFEKRKRNNEWFITANYCDHFQLRSSWGQNCSLILKIWINMHSFHVFIQSFLILLHYSLLELLSRKIE